MGKGNIHVAVQSSKERDIMAEGILDFVREEAKLKCRIFSSNPVLSP
jgi:hypothetical protein